VTALQTDLPETQEQAEEWDRRASSYRRAGLCDACASSASTGHQLGWLRVPHPPCVACAPVVATFPKETADPAWRKWPQGRRSASVTRSAASLGPQASVDVLTGLNRLDGRQVS
jgi:hypothetical protein